MNRDQWTRFLYIEIESIGLNFFSALHVSCRSHSKNFQNVSQSSLSFPPTLSLSLSLTSFSFHLAPKLSFPLAPSLTFIPSRFVTVRCSQSHSLSCPLALSLSPFRSITPSPSPPLIPSLHRRLTQPFSRRH